VTVETRAAHADPQEVELKYAVRDPDALRARLEGELPEGISAGPWTTRNDEDAYVDTDDLVLAAAGYGARLRRRGSRFTLSLKSRDRARSDEGDHEPRGASLRPGSEGDGAGAGSVASGEHSPALHRRVELEGPATRSLDPATWPDSAAKERLIGIIGEAPLRIRFIVQQRRAVRNLHDEEGHSAELSLDEVRVRSRGKNVGSFNALEVEAVGEAGALLDRIAANLESSGLVEPEPRSKEVIAAELVEDAEDEAPDAIPGPEGRAAASADDSNDPSAPEDDGLPKPPRSPGVRVDDTLGAAGRKVLRMHLLRMLASEPGTRSGEVAEDLHKMRVATRRMRAAWRVFDGAYRPKLQRRYVRELRETATALGEVRDLDVQIDGLDEYLKSLSPAGAAAMDPLHDEWRRRRDSARERLLELLDSKGYAAFVADYREFVETPGKGEREPLPNAPILVRDTAGGRIWQAYERVRAHDTTLAWADVEGLHALRIDGKRLRYTLEFFREVLPRQSDELIARVTELQDHLGYLNDANVASHMTRTYLVSQASRLPAGSREAIGHYLDSREAEIARLRRLLPPIWRRLTAIPYRRRLGISISTL
jgi:CHAD domain-containing protein